MKEPFTRAARIVGDAENNLKKLLAETAAGGDYSLVVQLAGWAHRLSDLCAEIVKAAPPGAIASGPADAPETTGHNVSPAPRKRRAGDYPKFSRNGDTLVKTGWSKAQKSEYE